MPDTNRGSSKSREMPRDVARYLERYGDKLSRSTQRAHWIGTPEEHADRNGQTLATRSPDVIKLWAEERGAKPATAGDRSNGRPRVLRFDFPGYGGEGLEEISWDDWLGTFEQRKLAFVFQENLRNGNQSNFFKLDSPEREDG